MFMPKRISCQCIRPGTVCERQAYENCCAGDLCQALICLRVIRTVRPALSTVIDAFRDTVAAGVECLRPGLASGCRYGHALGRGMTRTGGLYSLFRRGCGCPGAVRVITLQAAAIGGAARGRGSVPPDIPILPCQGSRLSVLWMRAAVLFESDFCRILASLRHHQLRLADLLQLPDWGLSPGCTAMSVSGCGSGGDVTVLSSERAGGWSVRHRRWGEKASRPGPSYPQPENSLADCMVPLWCRTLHRRGGRRGRLARHVRRRCNLSVPPTSPYACGGLSQGEWRATGPSARPA